MHETKPPLVRWRRRPAPMSRRWNNRVAYRRYNGGRLGCRGQQHGTGVRLFFAVIAMLVVAACEPTFCLRRGRTRGHGAAPCRPIGASPRSSTRSRSKPRPADPYSVNVWGVGVDRNSSTSPRPMPAKRRGRRRSKPNHAFASESATTSTRCLPSAPEDPQELAGVVDAYIDKYGGERDRSFIRHAWVFRLGTAMTVGAGEPVSPAKLRWLTAANVISLARLAATPFSLAAVLDGNWRLAGLIFAGAVASDFLDGIIARWRGTVSNLGGVLDHTADAVFVAVTLWGDRVPRSRHRVRCRSRHPALAHRPGVPAVRLRLQGALRPAVAHQLAWTRQRHCLLRRCRHGDRKERTGYRLASGRSHLLGGIGDTGLNPGLHVRPPAGR